MDLLSWKENTSPSFRRECQREGESMLAFRRDSHSSLQKAAKEHCKVHFRIRRACKDCLFYSLH